MKTSRRYRAVSPEGVAPAFPDEPETVPTWDGDKFTPERVLELRDEFYPGWTLEVEVTVVQNWLPVPEPGICGKLLHPDWAHDCAVTEANITRYGAEH